jgi:hypothetical protein
MTNQSMLKELSFDLVRNQQRQHKIIMGTNDVPPASMSLTRRRWPNFFVIAPWLVMLNLFTDSFSIREHVSMAISKLTLLGNAYPPLSTVASRNETEASRKPGNYTKAPGNLRNQVHRMENSSKEFEKNVTAETKKQTNTSIDYKLSEDQDKKLKLPANETTQRPSSRPSSGPTDAEATNKSNPNLLVDTNAEAAWKRRQHDAKIALERMKARHAFETSTNMTTRETVLNVAFPVNWDPCTLQRIFEAKIQKSDTTPLQIVIHGGSISARPASRCNKQDPITCRIGNLLERNLNQESKILLAEEESTDNITTPATKTKDNQAGESLSFEVVNMAQGGMTTGWFGLSMDELVDPTRTDVLVWEFCVNDFQSPNKARIFAFWLARIEALLQRRPPIIFVCVWPFHAGDANGHNSIPENAENLGQMMNESQPFVEAQKAKGWNIQAIDVGSTIDRNVVAADPSLLFDDFHHPNTFGVNLVADMLEHAIFSDVATCGSDIHAMTDNLRSASNQENVLSVIKESTYEDFDDYHDVWIKDLWRLFVRPDVRMGSVTAWEPKAVATTGLNLENRAQVMKYDVVLLANNGHQEAGRTDRKNVYILPLCNSGESLKFILLEPDLEWLGLIVIPTAIETTINDVIVEFNKIGPKKWDFPGSLSLLHLSGAVPVSARYELCICQKDISVGPNFSQLIGLMPPKPSTNGQ